MSIEKTNYMDMNKLSTPYKVSVGIDIKHKKCTKCKEVKSIENFSKYKKSKDGLRYDCKACNSIDKKRRKWKKTTKPLNIMKVSKKTCSKCKEVKSSLEFYKNKYTSDGLFSYCKQCSSIYQKEYNRKKKMEIMELKNKISICDKVGNYFKKIIMDF